MSWKKYFKEYDTAQGLKSPMGSVPSQSTGNTGHARYNTWLPEVYAGQPNRIERYYQY